MQAASQTSTSSTDSPVGLSALTHEEMRDARRIISLLHDEAHHPGAIDISEMDRDVADMLARLDHAISHSEPIHDGPPSRCTGACGTIARLGKRQWDDEGFCTYCGEDGNA